MNRSLKLIRYANVEGKGWRRGQVVKLKNGKLKAGVMILGGVEVACPNGRYQMLRYEQDKAVYTDLGNDAAEAWTRYSLESTKQDVKLAAVDAGLHILTEDDPKAKSLKRYAADFLVMHASLPHRSDDSSRVYRQVTETFLKISKAIYPKDVTKEDVVLWHGWLRKEKAYSDRTASGHYMALRGFLAFCKLVPRELISPGTHKLLKAYTKRIVDIYKPEIVDELMKASLEDNRSLLWNFAYKTGLRDSELQMVTRFDLHDLDGDEPMLHVKERDEYGQIKDAEERTVELHSSLVPGLKSWIRENPTKILLFGTSADKPDSKMLLFLKLTAKRAGLNCGRCKGCLGPKNHCREYTLHRFRRTFTTRLLRATGGDLRSVMARTGHSDITSVMRYLAPAQQIRDAVANAF